MVKKIAMVVSIIVFCIGGYFAFFWLQYYSAIEKSNRETATINCKNGAEDEFFGKIVRVERYEHNDFMNANFFALEILTIDAADRFKTYQFNLNEYSEVLDFVKVGQSIEKNRGQDKFQLKNEEGNEKSFTIPYCKLLKDQTYLSTLKACSL